MIYHYLCGFSFLFISLLYSKTVTDQLSLKYFLIGSYLVIYITGIFVPFIKTKPWLFAGLIILLFFLRVETSHSRAQEIEEKLQKIAFQDPAIERYNTRLKELREKDPNTFYRSKLWYKNSYYLLQGKIEKINGFKRDRFQVLVKLEKIIYNTNKPSQQKAVGTSTNYLNFSEDHSSRLLVHSYVKPTNLLVGNTVLFKPNFLVRTSFMDESDYRSYLQAKDILGSAYLNRETIHTLLVGGANDRYLSKVWKYIEEKAYQFMNPTAASLVFSLLTGNKDNLSDRLKENFRKTGTYHVLAVSGMHAAFLSIFFFYLFRLLGLRRMTALLPIFLFILPGYLWLTNFQISIVRTYLMGLIAYLLKLFDCQVNLVSVLIITLILSLFYDPDFAYQVSFQLSFSAVFGIGVMIEFIKAMRVKNHFVQGLLVSVGAQLGTLGFIVYYFGYVNFLAAFYNLFISIAIGIYYTFILLFYLIPHELFSTSIGHFLNFLQDVISTYLTSTRYDFDWYNLEAVRNNLPLAIVLFLVYFGLFQAVIYWKKTFLRKAK